MFVCLFLKQGSGISRQNSSDIPNSSLRNPRKTNFRGRARTFRPPRLHVEDPQPTGRSLEKKINLCALFSCLMQGKIPRLCKIGVLELLHIKIFPVAGRPGRVSGQTDLCSLGSEDTTYNFDPLPVGRPPAHRLKKFLLMCLFLSRGRARDYVKSVCKMSSGLALLYHFPERAPFLGEPPKGPSRTHKHYG